MKKLRVPLPSRRSNEMLDLAEKVLKKHETDAADSALIKLDWLKVKAAITRANELHTEIENLRVERAKRVTDRNTLMDDITKTMRSSRDILSGVYIDNMQNLGSWGFEVIEAVASKAEAKVKAEKPTKAT